MKKTLLIAAALLTSHVVSAQITTFFSDASSLSPNYKLESDGSTYIAAAFDGSSIFGSGDALRVADLTSTDKPEIVWNTQAPVTGAFRLDLRAALNTPITGDSQDINLRFGDTDDEDVGASSRTLVTISFEATGQLKINGSNPTDFTFTQGVAANISLIFNPTGGALDYTLYNQSFSLEAGGYQAFVDGVLITTTTGVVAGASYDLTKGLGKLGFVGSSDAAQGMDYVFDDIILFEGADISVPISAVPEPSSFALIAGIMALGCIGTRRRRVAA